jgi:CheY-like chemotaxis protein
MPTDKSWRILAIDDDPEIGEQIVRILTGELFGDKALPADVVSMNDFNSGLLGLEEARFDVVVLDVMLHDGGGKEEAGVRALAEIQARRFVPVVFYTALPPAVEHLKKPPLIQVVEKTAGAGIKALREAVRMAFDSGLPGVNRELMKHVEEVQRDYMWGFVSDNWSRLGAHDDRSSLAYLLARRLAVSLSGDGVEAFAKGLGGTRTTPQGKQPPMRLYLLPPPEVARMGDIVSGSVNGREGHWVVLSSSCDLEQGKASFVLLVGTEALIDQPEARGWRDAETPSGTKLKLLDSLLVNNRDKTQADRFHFLPAALTIPDLVVDFQRVESVERSEFDKLERLASIDSPYAESLLSRFVRFYGRVGTPDLDNTPTIDRVRPPAAPPAAVRSTTIEPPISVASGSLAKATHEEHSASPMKLAEAEPAGPSMELDQDVEAVPPGTESAR